MKKAIVIILALTQAFIFTSPNWAAQIIDGNTSASKKSTIIPSGVKSFSRPSLTIKTTPKAKTGAVAAGNVVSAAISTATNNTPPKPKPSNDINKKTETPKTKAGAVAVGNGVGPATNTQGFNGVTGSASSSFSNNSVIKKETTPKASSSYIYSSSYPYQYSPYQNTSPNAIGSSSTKKKPSTQSPSLTEASNKLFVSFLINRLESRYSWVKETAKTWLAAIGEPAVGSLSEALSNPANSVSLRQEVAGILGRIDSPEAAQALITALGDENKSVRSAVKDTLVQIGDPAIGPLSEALNNSTNSVSLRQEVAGILGQIGSPGAVRALITALEDESIFSAVVDAFVQIGAPAVAPLSEILHNPANSESARQSAALALGFIGTPEATQALIAVVVDKQDDPKVRTDVALALGLIGDPEATQVLIAVLGDKQDDPKVRTQAASALGLIGGPEATQVLIAVLGNKNEDEEVRSAAASALGRIGGPEATQALIAVLGNKNEDEEVRSAAAFALSRLDSPEATQVLIAVLGNKNEDESVRSAAARSLGLIGSPPIKALLIALGDENTGVRSAAASALFQIGKSAEEPFRSILVAVLRTALTDSDPLVRRGARQILVARFGNSEFKNYLIDRIKNESNSTARQYLEESLAKVDEALGFIDKIEQRYQIKLDDRFDVIQLQSILTVLQTFPADELKGLDKIDFVPKKGWFHFGGYIPADDHTSGYTTIQLRIFDPELTFSVLFHELGHFFDDKYFGDVAFRDLYARSQYPEDFAEEYGETDSYEDFATTFEVYTADTKANFLRALTQAQEGKPVYLEKLLLVLDFSTKGHPDYAIIYKVEGTSVREMRIGVSRDATNKITHIKGVSITDLEDLKKLFGTLDF